MPEGQDEDHQLVVLYGVHDAVVADANPQKGATTLERLRAVGARIRPEEVERVEEAALDWAVQTSDRSLGGRGPEGLRAVAPNGVFNANAVWLICAVMAFNLTRAAALTEAPSLARAATATIRRKPICVPARIATTTRRLHLHLPTHWAWESAWSTLYDTVMPPPARAEALGSHF